MKNEGDEIGMEESAFNQLVEDLRQTRAQLEARVNERTAELASANRELERQIAERRRAESALLESEAQARQSAHLMEALFNAIPDVIGVQDRQQRIVRYNAAGYRMLGLTADQTRGKHCYELIGRGRACDLCATTECLKTKQPAQVEKFLSDLGLWLECRSYPVLDEAGEIAYIIEHLRDITKRKQTETALQRIEWMLTRRGGEGDSGSDQERPVTPEYGDLSSLNTCRLILDGVGPAMLHDIVSDYLDLLETSATVYERNGDYALGLLSSGWCRFMDRASRNLCRTDNNQEALNSGQWHCHESCWTDVSKRCLQTGQPVDRECAGGLRIYAVPIRAGQEILGAINVGYGDPPRDPAKLRELAAKYGVDAEALARQADAYESRPPFIIELAKRRLSVSARLIGEIVERKRAMEERDQLQSQLIQAQKIESVGRLAGGVAHDFNNMLQVILGNVALALQDLPPESPVREDLEEINKSALRSMDLTRQLLAFARKQTIAPKLLDFNETISGMLKMLRRLIRENIELIWKPGANLWPVKLDPSQIDQVMANLCINARDAIHGAGRITIETVNVSLDMAYVKTHPECLPGEYVLLSVSDTGKGIDAYTRAHLFEPFFTTKEQGKGTGLGLATIFGIIKQNLGFISVGSELGQGTTFKIYLPRAADPLLTTTEAFPKRDLRGTETILLVEDEHQILVLAQRILKQYGYSVLAARAPAEALRLAIDHPGTIHLLITDVVMPGMNGRELRDRLASLKPGLRCLFMSGYTADVIAHHGVLDEGVQFLQKPFTVDSLAERVREALTSS